MDKEAILRILECLKTKGELPYIEAKNSLPDKEQIGKTLSALSNSASYHNQEYAYIIWGIENGTWDVIGTEFDIEKESQGKKGFILPQIIDAFNHGVEIARGAFGIDGRRLFVLRIKNSGNDPLYFNKIAYIRIGEVNDELSDHPEILKFLINKNVDWSGQTPEGSSLDWIDEDAFAYMKGKYFEIRENQKKQLNKRQLLNTLSLLDAKGKPNNTCLLFIGKKEISDEIFRGKNKITWNYRDELNGIEERLAVDEESVPLIFGTGKILDRINKFNTTLQDIDLFRNDVTQYDTKVIEEMVINAIAHRDWNMNLWIEVIQTPVSLEIRNPGRFRADINKVLLENKRPEYLNPNLADFLKKMHLMEKEGGGLKKVYASQIRKGLSVKPKFDNESAEPRVDFTLSGRVKDVAFARFMFSSKALSQDQVIILDKIYSGKNILGQDLVSEEYALVENLVTKVGKGGVSLKIKEHLLKKSKAYIENFSSTHASHSISKEIILDYAKKNGEFTTAEVYDILNGKTKETVRSSLMEMVRAGSLHRVKRGVYVLVKTIQTKTNNNYKKRKNNK